MSGDDPVYLDPLPTRVGRVPPTGDFQMAAPVLMSLDPAEAPIGSADVTMTVTGKGFTEQSTILFNGGAEATTFIDDTHLSTVVKPSTAVVTGAFPVTVKNGAAESNALEFTFTDAPPD